MSPTNKPEWLRQVPDLSTPELTAAIAEFEAKAGGPQEVITDKKVMSIALRKLTDLMAAEAANLAHAEGPPTAE